jgi:hypothetical protein
MVGIAHFTAAKQSRLYLRHEPIIAAEKRLATHVAAFGFINPNLPNHVKKLMSELQISLSHDLKTFNNAASLLISQKELDQFALQIAKSVATFKTDSLHDLSERGIISPENIAYLSCFKHIPTSDISQASMDMILEYRNANLPFKHQLLMIKRFLPVSYLNWMVKEHSVSKSSTMRFINYKTFPHIEIRRALDIAKSLSEEYKDISYSDAWRFTVY